MNTTTNITQDICANSRLSAPQINTLVKTEKQLTCPDLINESFIEVIYSPNENNNSDINTIHHVTSYLPLEKKYPSLTRKSQLHDIITHDNGIPDYLAINIYYDTLRSWHVPNKIKKQDGTIVHISKLKTKGIYFSYKKLSELHGCSTETIRRKLVKLENLGLIQRGFKHRETATTKSYNQLIIYVWRHTPHFFNKHGVNQSEVGEFKPQTNHKYIAEKYNIDYHFKIEQIKAIESKGGIHTGVDTKELIEPFNKLKDRSNESNFCKLDLNLNYNCKNLKPDNKQIEGLVKVEDDEAIKTSCTANNTGISKENKIALAITNNGFLGNGKTLKDLLEHLTDEMCSTLRSNSGRNFTDRAIREIAKAVSKSKKGSRAFFYHIKGFIAYLSKIMRFEKRDPVKISSVNYYIAANQTTEEKDVQKQEKYLTELEYSLQVSPEWHFKKKLASVLERRKAYNLLTSYKTLEIKEGGLCRLELSRAVELTTNDKEIILNQIKATHSNVGLDSKSISIEEVEFVMPKYKKASKSFLPRQQGRSQSSNNSKDLEQATKSKNPKTIWDQIRAVLAKQYGEGIDKAWFSKLSANINNSNKEITLKSSSEFVIDWINNNYSQTIRNIASNFEFKLKIENV